MKTGDTPMRTNVYLLLILLLGLSLYACKSGQGEKYGYQRTDLTTEQRVNDLLGWSECRGESDGRTSLCEKLVHPLKDFSMPEHLQKIGNINKLFVIRFASYRV